jgi:hypothetical protein
MKRLVKPRSPVVYPRTRMSTTLVAALLAGFGLLAVLAVSYAFYLVGRAEDRDREGTVAAPAEPETERPAHRSADHPEGEHRVARDRRRPLPPRRPQR